MACDVPECRRCFGPERCQKRERHGTVGRQGRGYHRRDKRTFRPGQSFFEPPGATHLVAANAGNTEPAELALVADEGAQLTTFIE